MRGLARFFFGLSLLVTVALVVAASSGAHAGVINNGLEPPNPDNVIDDGTYRKGWVLVRNLGCPPGWGGPAVNPWDPCPGTTVEEKTAVEVVDGGSVWLLEVNDFSSIMISGGVVNEDLEANSFSSITMSDGTVTGGLEADDSSLITMSGGEVAGGLGGTGTITMSGGTVGEGLEGEGLSTITMSGGTVGEDLEGAKCSSVSMSGGTVSGDLDCDDFCRIVATGGTVLGSLHAEEFCTIWIVGTDFEVDGVPVGYGPIDAVSGTLTGVLESADPINNYFWRHETASIILADDAPELPPCPLILLNDGGSHVISDDSYQSNPLVVRNAGCGSSTDPWEDCSSPGEGTDLALVTNAKVGELTADDSSIITMSGGEVTASLISRGRSAITMSGGAVGGVLEARHLSAITFIGGTTWGLHPEEASTITMGGGTTQFMSCDDESTIIMRGGRVVGSLHAEEFCTIWIVGTDFEVDGVPVGYGPIDAVSGTLTGVLESGDPINNYFWRQEDDAARIVLTDTEPDPALILWNDGGPHVISDAVYEGGFLIVRNSGCGSYEDPLVYCPLFGDPTPVELVGGGEVWHLLSLDSSTITISGGTVWGRLEADDFSSVLISGGIVHGELEVNSSSSITMSGGIVDGDLEADDIFTTITMNGGTVGGDLWAGEFSEITMSGGVVVGNLGAEGVASVTIRGGTVGGQLYAYDFSTIEIFGSDFKVDDNPVLDDDDCFPIAALSGRLTGTLESGDTIDNEFSRDESSIICVPEPTQTLLHAGALATLALLRRRRA